jgi:Apea-like HEPN
LFETQEVCCVTQDKRTLSRKDFRDYEFILKEMEQVLGMTGPELIAYYNAHQEDALYTLPRNDGRGHLPFTRKGEVHFYEIARRGLRAMGSQGEKYELQAVVDALKSAFMEGDENEPPVTPENAHEIFEGVTEQLGNNFEALTHHIPCVIIAHDHPQQFNIGPVRFARQDVFFRENEATLRKTFEEPGYGWGFEALKSFFRQFSWVAEVTISAAEQKVSTYRARKIVQVALDILKAVVGSRRGAGIRQAYDHGMPSQIASLNSAAGKGFSPSWGSRSHDAVLTENWHELISTLPFWEISKSILQTYSDSWELPVEPHQRFLDALQWHGEGVSDPEPSSRAIKYWIAVERLASLRSNDTVTRKAALLSCDDLKQFSNQFEKCQRLYTKRCAIVHGSASRDSIEIEAVALEIENLSKKILFSYSQLIAKLETLGRCNREGLEAEFKSLNHQLRSRTGAGL